jgi:hypothetical protein
MESLNILIYLSNYEEEDLPGHVLPIVLPAEAGVDLLHQPELVLLQDLQPGPVSRQKKDLFRKILVFSSQKRGSLYVKTVFWTRRYFIFQTKM